MSEKMVTPELFRPPQELHVPRPGELPEPIKDLLPVELALVEEGPG